MAVILGIESTCDETAASVVVDGRRVLSNVIASQADIHAKFRGVVPEIASRAHIENILPVLGEALSVAGIAVRDVDAVAVAHRPGLIGSLLIGVTAAKTLAWAVDKPLIGVDHVHAHLYSVMLDQDSVDPQFPAVGLVCSGGHTAIYKVRSFADINMVGHTIDDAVGEAYDKVAAILGLGYPGGPILDRLAKHGDAKAVRFPRTMLERESLDFSFSGLKTAVLYHVRGVPKRGQTVSSDHPALSEQAVLDIAASFQDACVDVLMKKLRRGIEKIGARSVIVGGGVSANSKLRSALPSLGLPAFIPKLAYCTDNAAMSAGLAQLYFERGEFSGLDLDAVAFSQF